MSFEWFVASRYLRAKGRTRFRSLITLLAVGGVAVGVAAAILVLGVMNGFSTEVRERIVGTNAHVVLLDLQERGIEKEAELRAEVESQKDVVATAPFVFGKVMLSSDFESEGAILRGVEPELEEQVTDVPARVVPADASFESQAAADGRELPGMVLGVDLAARLRVGVDQTIVVTVPNIRKRGIPRMRTFRVAGLWESGIYEYDSSYALTSIAASQDALGMESTVTGILVRVNDMDRAPEIGKEIAASIESPPLWSNDWVNQNRQLFLWMKLEKLVGYMLFAIVLTVAAFLIASTLIMIVLEKTREIGILMTLGAERRKIRSIFLYEGLAIGGIGTGAGCLLGWVGSWLLDRYKLNLPGDIYFIETLPVAVWWGDLVMIAALSIVICVLSAIYPSWRASRLVPVEAIRYD